MEALLYAMLMKYNTTNIMRSNDCQNIKIVDVATVASRVYSSSVNVIQKSEIGGGEVMFYISVETPSTDITIKCKK